MNILFPVINNNKLLFIDFTNNKTYETKNDIVLEEVDLNIDVSTTEPSEVEIPKELSDILILQSELQNKNFYKEYNKEN